MTSAVGTSNALVSRYSFRAELSKPAGRGCLAADELEDAKWFECAQVADPKAHGIFVPGPYSLAGQLVEAFLAGRHA